MSRKINPLSRSRRVKDTDPVADGERQLLINEQPSKVILYMSGKATNQELSEFGQRSAMNPCYPGDESALTYNEV
jgi:hypothetical protein